MERIWSGRALSIGLLSAAFAYLIAAGCPREVLSLPVRVSQPSAGGALDADILFARPNGNGSVVLLLTAASNLVEGDRNGKSDVYVVDANTLAAERISVSFLGRDANDGSFPGVLADDGLLVVFGSAATNLVTGDFNHTPDLFLFDRTTRRTFPLTLANEGLGGGTVPDLPPAVSPDARWIAFASQADDLVENDRNEASDVFVLDRESGTLTVMTMTALGATEVRTANGASAGPAISTDGCVVAFFSDATNLVERDRNEARDVFVRDRCNNSIERASVASDGSEANGPSQAELATLALSGDGRFVAFASRATNLDGDTGGRSQVFIRDRLQGTTRLGSRNQAGDVANAPSVAPALDRDGRFLVFQSSASNLSTDDPWPGEDVFVVDLTDGEVQLVSKPSDGGSADGDSFSPSISADGSHIVFLSKARLIPTDTDSRIDAYLVANPMFGKPPAGGTPTPTPDEEPTATPSSTATWSPSATAVTPTEPSPTSTSVPPTVTGTPSSTSSPTPPSPTNTVNPTSAATATSTTAAPTPSPTRPAGGGGDGCSCRVDPNTGKPAPAPISPLVLLPVALLAWRRRLRQR
ncbi:MAG: hypothetical protein N3C12_03485 [Candidatus Binatia bacterium]|nr:hypothetical protein [Candidatus Binatia bacterium]